MIFSFQKLKASKVIVFLARLRDAMDMQWRDKLRAGLGCHFNWMPVDTIRGPSAKFVWPPFKHPFLCIEDYIIK